MDDGGGVELLDDGRARDAAVGPEPGAVVNRRLRERPAGEADEAAFPWRGQPVRGRQLGLRGAVEAGLRRQAQIDDFDRVLRIAEAVGELMRIEEPVAEVVQPLRQRHGELEILSDMAHVERYFGPPAFRVRLAREPEPGLFFQLLQNGRDAGERLARDGDALAAGEGLAEVRDQQPLRADDAGSGRHEDFTHADAGGHVARMQWPRAAEGRQHIAARVVAALDRDGADRADHVGGDDVEHAFRGALDRKAETRSDRLEGGTGLAFVEPHAAVQQAARAEPPEQQVGVGDGRLGVAMPVTGGAGVGAGALRADLHQPVAVEPGDGAAARPDGRNVDLRQADGEARHGALIGNIRLAAPDERHVGTGAAHVECDEVAEARAAGGVDRADDARGRPRKGGADREVAGARHRHQPAARLVDAQAGAGRDGRETFFQPAEVTVHDRLQGRVDGRGGEALELAELGLHLGR